jgi:uncharacterized BrkB/YihY/UPF0761 family membrane protein
MLYGSLSTLGVFFFWIYYSSLILLLGAEIAFLLEKEDRRIHPHNLQGLKPSEKKTPLEEVPQHSGK